MTLICANMLEQCVQSQLTIFTLNPALPIEDPPLRSGETLSLVHSEVSTDKQQVYSSQVGYSVMQ